MSTLKFPMPAVRALIVLGALAAATFALGACGGGSDGGPTGAPADPKTVTATSSLAFTPSSLTVHAGDSVTFAFGSVAHNVYFDATAGVPANIAGQNANVSVRRGFAAAGTYHYSCHIHPSMHGTVVVQ